MDKNTFNTSQELSFWDYAKSYVTSYAKGICKWGFHSENASSVSRRRNLKSQQSPVILICVWGKLRQRNDYHEFIVFVKFCFQNVFRPMWKRKAGVLSQISPVWRVCRKSSVFATYSKRNHGNQAAFSNSSCLVWTGPYQTYLEPLNRRKQQYSARQRFHHHSKPVRNTPPHDVHVTTVP